MKSKLGYLCGSNSWGGLEMNQLKNAIWMKQKGYPVNILCWKNSPIHQNAIIHEIDICLIEKHKKYYQFQKALKLKKIITENNITHLIIRSNHDLSIGASVKWFLKRKIHLSFFMEMQLGIRKTSIFHTIRYQFYDIWSCPLVWLKEQVVKNVKIDQSKIILIPSAIELNKFIPNESKIKYREHLKLPLNQIIIGIIGRIDQNKAQHIAVEALLNCKNKSFTLLIVGEPTYNERDDYHKYIQKLIIENQLQHRIILHHFNQNIENYYFAIDAVINTTKSETVGMTTIEALATGLPVIGANSGGTKELINSEKLGLLYEPLNSFDLSVKIDELINNIHNYNSIEISNSIKNFDHNSICNEIEKILLLKK